MIQIQIITNRPQEARQLASQLIEEKLILDAKIMKFDKIGAKGRVYRRSISQYMVIGRTKALLFPVINRFVRKRAQSKSLEIYSVPIVHMDEHQAAILRKSLAKV